MSCLATKPTKWHVRPAKTQINLGIHPVWSESSLCTQWVAKDPSLLHADSEDSDQTGRMPRLICLRCSHMPLCWFCHEAAQLLLFYSWRNNQLVSSGFFCLIIWVSPCAFKRMSGLFNFYFPMFLCLMPCRPWSDTLFFASLIWISTKSLLKDGSIGGHHWLSVWQTEEQEPDVIL